MCDSYSVVIIQADAAFFGEPVKSWLWENRKNLRVASRSGYQVSIISMATAHLLLLTINLSGHPVKPTAICMLEYTFKAEKKNFRFLFFCVFCSTFAFTHTIHSTSFFFKELHLLVLFFYPIKGTIVVTFTIPVTMSIKAHVSISITGLLSSTVVTS